MTLFERLRYSLYLSAVGGAAIILVLSIASADVVGWLPPSAGHRLFSPRSFCSLSILLHTWWHPGYHNDFLLCETAREPLLIHQTVGANRGSSA
jgi:hypothetical protein